MERGLSNAPFSRCPVLEVSSNTISKLSASWLDEQMHSGLSLARKGGRVGPAQTSGLLSGKAGDLEEP